MNERTHDIEIEGEIFYWWNEDFIQGDDDGSEGGLFIADVIPWWRDAL